MSRDQNKGVMMCCKTITSNLLTVVGFLVEPSTSISKPKGYIEASLLVGKPPLIVTSK